MIELVQELEKRLAFSLPQDYRKFLIGHHDPVLEQSLVFKPPRSGSIDTLLTVQGILKNDDEKRIGIPERSLLHIGGNVMAGYLYLDVSEKAWGEVRYLENYEFREHFTSFTAFLDETEKEVDPGEEESG